LNNVTAAVLIVVGLIGIIIGTLDLFVELDKLLPFLKKPEDILLITVAALAVALGIERRTIIGELETEVRRTHFDMVEAFNAVQQVLISGVPFQVLTSEKAIFEEALRLINMCKDSDVIRVTGLTPAKAGEEETQDYTNDYFSTIAKRIKRAKKRGGSLAYRVVLGEEPPPERRKTIQKRHEAFSAEGVLDRLVIRSLDTTWPLEMFLLVDSMIIGFVSLTGDLTFRVGIRVTDKELVGHISEWYDDFLWNTAKVENWEK